MHAKGSRNKGDEGSEGKVRAKSSLFVTDEVPLYYQLATILEDQISSGQYRSGAQIPTEAELVEEYGVSRITVRQALRSLEENGLIRREAGRGTFVTGRRRADTLEVKGSLDDLISIGLATSVKLLDLREVAATAQDADALGLPEGAPLVRVTRLRYYHREPYSYIVNHLPEDIGRHLSRAYLEHGAILHFVEHELGIHLQDADQTVRASIAKASLARLLQVRIGAPLLCVDRVVRSDQGRAVERVHTYYRSDIYSLRVHLERDPEPGVSGPGWAYRAD